MSKLLSLLHSLIPLALSCYITFAHTLVSSIARARSLWLSASDCLAASKEMSKQQKNSLFFEFAIISTLWIFTHVSFCTYQKAAEHISIWLAMQDASCVCVSVFPGIRLELSNRVRSTTVNDAYHRLQTARYAQQQALSLTGADDYQAIYEEHAICV